jgi:hypothetical protein
VILRNRQTALWIDSGAFTAWSKGERIDLRNYVAFLQHYHAYLCRYVALDVIPPKGASPGEVEEAARRSYSNLEHMRDEGLSPIPVFHQRERLYWLERLVGEGHEYIGLGGMAKLNQEERRRWLDSVFSFLEGRVQVHGFAVGSRKLLLDLPWYSVDCTTMVSVGVRGCIAIPRRLENGRADYVAPPRIENITRTGVPLSRDARDYLREEGFSDAELFAATQLYGQPLRHRINSRYYLGIQKLKPDLRMTVNILPVDLTRTWLQEEGIRCRMLSFAFLDNWWRIPLPEYVRHGLTSRAVPVWLREEIPL